MARPKILALILAGGAGGRLDVLTDRRAKPALPFAGTYRLIDFALSNCANSGLADVWVVEQYQPHDLNEHLANGRPWDLDRTRGGLQVLPPYTGREGEGFAQGNADALYRNRHFLRDFAPDVLLVLSADHVYKQDYRDVIDAHRERGADLTMGITQVARAEASRFGVVRANRDGRVTNFAYKPDEPDSDWVTTEVFVYNPRVLTETLDALVEEKKGESGDNEPVLKDFGHELIPRLVAMGNVHACRLDGYWRDVGTIDSYFAAHQDLIRAEPPLVLDDPDWPIRSRGGQRPPARILGGARLEDSLVSPGCTIHGQVVRSVLAPGVVVAAGAVVRDAVVLHDAVIEAGATVDHAILDEAVRVGREAVVGNKAAARGDARREITLVGRGAQISPGRRVPAGGRIGPGVTAGV